MLRESGETSAAAYMESSLLAFEAACGKLRHRRNKWIAHNDLGTLLGARAAPLSDPSREEVENALGGLRHVMHVVEQYYTQSETAYEHFIMQSDGEHLLASLLQAKRYRELVDEGTISREDFRRRFPSGA
jgi:hypothetical protein